MATFRLGQHSRVHSLQNQNENACLRLYRKSWWPPALVGGRRRGRAGWHSNSLPGSSRLRPSSPLHRPSGMSLLTHKPGHITTCSEPIRLPAQPKPQVLYCTYKTRAPASSHLRLYASASPPFCSTLPSTFERAVSLPWTLIPNPPSAPPK